MDYSDSNLNKICERSKENHKSLMKELNKWSYILYSWRRRLNIVINYVISLHLFYPQVIYNHDHSLRKISTNPYQSSYGEAKDWNSQHKTKKEQSWRLTLLNCKTYYEATVIRTVRYRQKNRQIINERQ